MLPETQHRTAFLTDPVFRKHQTGWAHPEQQKRMTAIAAGLKQAGLWEKLFHLTPHPATVQNIAAIHDLLYIEKIRLACEEGGLFEPDDVTLGSPGTYEAALMAAGAVLTATDAVMDGRISNAFCAVRPPGHHAEKDRAMGFCFFNNVAIAARHLQHRHGIRRIAIVDWDVHHGNGTQHAFEDDPSVFYFSIHQVPLYPGSGLANETGIGAGTGFTMNVPVGVGATDNDYRREFMESLKPALAKFKPEFILISAGFDAHNNDPLAGTVLTEHGFGDLTGLVMDMANEHSQGRLVSVLEGGYDLPALAASVTEHLRVLSQQRF